MHLSPSPHFLNVFNSKVVCFFVISVIFLGITWADKSPSYKARNQWSLKHSNPTSEGEFLNVPVYYGDWVPISSAKAQIESLLSSVKTVPNNNRRKDENVVAPPPIWATDDLTSPVKSSFVVSDHQAHSANQHAHHQVHHSHHHEAEERVEIDHHAPTHFIGPKLPSQQVREPTVRHSSINRPYNRGRNQYRGGHSRRKHRPTNSDALTRLFGPSLGWNGNRRQHRKIPQPPQSSLNSIPFVDQISSIFGPSPTQYTTAPQTSTGSAALQTLETLGNHWPSLSNIRVNSNSDNSYVIQDASESIFQPIVKVLPSPDLAQDTLVLNPLIYKDDGNGEGDIIVGRRPGQNEIGEFVPVSSGQTIRADSHKHHRRPSNFSVLISGIKEGISAPNLARLFKEGKIAEDGEHNAFIGNTDAFAPDGFHKINLPFMDPSQSASDLSKLPSIFIAPLGYKAPKGYKGHPLPFDPAPADQQYLGFNKGKINLVHSTEPSTSDEVNDVANEENKVKTIKYKNPFLRNKLRNQRLPYKPIKTVSTTEPTFILADLTSKADYVSEKADLSETSDSSNYVRSKIKFTRNRYKPQRKRVLTKIVRKPYTPSLTTPTPTLESNKIVRIVDPTPISIRVQDYFPPTSGRPILRGRNDDTIDLVVDQDYNSTEVKSTIDIQVSPSLGISTTFRPIEIKYFDLEPKKKAISFYKPKATETPQEDRAYETEDKIVDHFEPTTTHNIVIFETTKSDEETTYRNYVETDNKEAFEEEEDVTTVAPTSFVTRSTFTPAITTYKPSKNIQFIPYSPAATTISTTSSPTTTSKVATESSQSYEPTPFNFLDPIARLEKLNRLKNKKYGKDWSSGVDKEEDNEYIIPTVRPSSIQLGEKTPYKVLSNRIKYRKYGFNQGKDDGRIFGQRIKERKRTNVWDNGFARDNLYPTTTEAIETTSQTKTKSEEYKKKFRPFFDQLYERLNHEKNKDIETPEGNNRRISVFSVRRKIRPYKGWRKKSRSTTPPNPFTINAEIYEVHPKSRARITTTEETPPSPTFEVVTESSTLYQEYDNELDEGDHNSNYQSETLREKEDYEENKVHETADKHTPVFHDYDSENTSFDEQEQQTSSPLILIPFQDQSQFKPDLEDAHDEFSHNGLVDSNVALDFGESQFLEDSLNEVKVSPPKSVVPPSTRLLDQYEKTFNPSNQIANKYDLGYKEQNGIINEHSQQKITVKEGDFIPFHNIREGDNWEPRPLVPYVEIDRVKVEDEEPLSISVETVPTTSLIQEVLDEVYHTSKSAKVGSSQQKGTYHQNEIDYQPLPDYSNEYNEESDYVVTATDRIESGENDISSTTISNANYNNDEDSTTKVYEVDTKKNEPTEQTTISFFITPTAEYVTTTGDDLLLDPLPTLQDNLLILENVDSDEVATSTSESVLKDESSQETTTSLEELSEEAVPEGVEGVSTDNYNTINSDKDTTGSITTVAATTLLDNFEVTTFRPRGNGGFFENFNLANLLSYIVPKRTATTTTPLTTETTAQTTEEKSKYIPETTTVTLLDDQSEIVSELKDSYTTEQVLNEDTLSTDVPSTAISEILDQHTATLVHDEQPKEASTASSTASITKTTKTFSTNVPVEEETTVQTTARYHRVPHTRFETTTKEEAIDATTKSGILLETTTDVKSEETTRDNYEDEYDQTTASYYISTTTSSRIRTERPFRGPFRIQKNYKKNANRYNRNNRNKNNKFGLGLKKKLDDKNKKDSTISKAVYGAIKREEYIKNWVARKYNKLENNSKNRFNFNLNTTFQPQTTNEPSLEETTQEVTTTESQTSVAVDTTTSARKNAALPFSPTILPPKNKLFNVDLDVTIRDGSTTSSVVKASSLSTVTSAKNYISEKRQTFLDKLKSKARKSSSDNLFAKNIKNGKSSETSSSSISLPTQKSSKKISWVYPRGSDTKVFKTWGGNSLSQAEFERSILGVSVAKEESVKSRICVRGRCYDADDKSLQNK